MTTVGNKPSFREPDEDEKATRGAKLVGWVLSIFWEGDNEYYPCEVKSYDPLTKLHIVKYLTEDCEEATEDLSVSVWKIWPGNKDHFISQTQKTTDKKTPPRMNYSDMVMEAVVQMDDKTGSSLQAIRKFIQTTFQVSAKHIASFNNLTLKAINKAVADKQLEVNKHSYRLTTVERDRRKRALQQSHEAEMRQKYDKNYSSGRGDLVGESAHTLDVLEQYSGTVLENNKLLRKQLLDLRKSRDTVLFSQYYAHMEPFLQEHQNYFQKLHQREAARSLMEESDSSGKQGKPVVKGSGNATLLDSKQLTALGKSLVQDDGHSSSRTVMSLDRRVHILQVANLVTPALTIPSVYTPPTPARAYTHIDPFNTTISGKVCAVLLDVPAAELSNNHTVHRYGMADVITAATLSHTQAPMSPQQQQLEHELVLNHQVVWPGECLTADVTRLYRYLLVKLGYSQHYLPVDDHDVECASGSQSSTTSILYTHTPMDLEFHGSSVIHPSRWNPSQLVQEIMKLKQISYMNVYYLENVIRSNNNTSNNSSSSDGTVAQAGSTTNADDEEENDCRLDMNPTQEITVLRDCHGVFLPHVSLILKLTQSYATKDTIPISNVTHFYIANGASYQVIRRLFCDPKRYWEVYKNTIVDTIKRKPILTERLLELLHGPRPVAVGASATDVESIESIPVVDSSTGSGGGTSSSSVVDAGVHAIVDASTGPVAVVDPIPAVPSQSLPLPLPALQPVTVPLLTDIGKYMAPSLTLHDYQVYGISWLVQMYKLGMPMILGDQMGLGKTVQTIGFISYLVHALKQRGPYFIIVPLSVLSNWGTEVEKFCPSLRAIRFHGPKAERNRIKDTELSDLRNFDIILTTYEMFVTESTYFRRRFMYTAVIVDEGHRLKNDKNLLSEKLKNIPTLSKVILTGTPMQNNMRELWALLHYLTPEVFPIATVAKFEEGFDLNRGTVNNEVLRRARRLLSVFMLRRVKADINFKLPHKKEVVVLVPLSVDQIAWYKYLLSSMDSEMVASIVQGSNTSISNSNSGSNSSNDVSGMGGANVSTGSLMELDPTIHDAIATVGAVTVGSREEGTAGATVNTNTDSSSGKQWRKLLNLVLQLRKVCNHIYLMPEGDAATLSAVDALYDTPLPVPTDSGLTVVQIERERKQALRMLELKGLVEGSGKLTMLDRMLPKMQADGHRVLIFSQFTSMLDILQSYCDLRQYNSVRLDGNTNRVQRRLDCKQFNAPNSKIFIFLISTRAGGLGLNLATADTVILYDSDWNPQVDLQAMERVHRIGQTKPVRIYRLICNGSVEERMLHKANKKLFLNAMVAEGSGGVAGGAFNNSGNTSNTGDNDRDDVDADAAIQEQEEDQPLQSGGITKSELVSLIRYGANAILDSITSASNGTAASSASKSTTLSDEQLDLLLERTSGRLETNNPNCTAILNSSTSDNSVGSSAVSTAPVEENEGYDLAVLNNFLCNSFMQGASSSSSDNDSENTDNSSAAAVVDPNQRHYMSLRQAFSFEHDGQSNSSNNKGKPLDAGGINISNITFEAKRERKQRIALINGKGTGYGGAVPVLAEFGHNALGSFEYTSTNDPQPIAEGKSARQRVWNHLEHCVLCGLHQVAKDEPESPILSLSAMKSRKKMTKKEAAKQQRLDRRARQIQAHEQRKIDSVLLKCAYCPNTCHTKCVQGTVLEPNNDPNGGNLNSFVCTHHHCVICNRNTSSAGGLLFRCTGCITAYCEDCLPSDDPDDPDGYIQSIGSKHLTLESECNYYCRQAYYIQCTGCVQREKMMNEEDDGDASADTVADDQEEEVDDNENDLSTTTTPTSTPNISRVATPTAPHRPNSTPLPAAVSMMEVLPTHELQLYLVEEEGEADSDLEDDSEVIESIDDAPSSSSSSGKKTKRSSTGKRTSSQDKEGEDEEDEEDGEGTNGNKSKKQRKSMEISYNTPRTNRYNTGSTGWRTSSRFSTGSSGSDAVVDNNVI